MATYKLMQDIEAEDHIIGPLSFRQFVFALIAVFFYYLSFLAVSKGGAFFLVILAPPALFFTFFAFPFGKDQPTEVWALAKIRYYFKPRARIWDQTGQRQLVTVTVPKKVEHVYTDGLEVSEVQSRLGALASTLDSRGWAVKNVNVSSSGQPSHYAYQNSDRVFDVSSMPQEVPTSDVRASDDILDERSNPIAHQFDYMIAQTAQHHRQELMATMNAPVAAVPAVAQPVAADNYWFMGGTANATQAQGGLAGAAVGQSTAEEEAIAQAFKMHNRQGQAATSHMRTLHTLDDQTTDAVIDDVPEAQVIETPQPVTPQPDPAILNLASNNDLDVATLARQAKKARAPEPPKDQGEVVISLR